MPAALLGATRCGRCARGDEAEQLCSHCGAPWTSAVGGTAGRDGSTPLAGVVTAATGRRLLALVLDLVVPVLLLALGVVIAADTATTKVLGWLPILLAVVFVGAQLTALVLRGRTVGRLLLRQRTVDDLTGTPVRSGRLLAWLTGAGPRPRLVTADLRRGHDPWQLRLGGRHASPSSGHAEVAAAVPGPAVAVPAQIAGARPSVGIVLDTGERYEITDALLVGRSPVDSAGSDRQLLAWPDLTRRLAKTHALLEWSGTVLWVTDLDSATGTSVLAPGGDRQLLAPGVRSAAVAGATIECGGRSMKVVPGA